jgi:hypothetical protein
MTWLDSSFSMTMTMTCLTGLPWVVCELDAVVSLGEVVVVGPVDVCVAAELEVERDVVVFTEVPTCPGPQTEKKTRAATARAAMTAEPTTDLLMPDRPPRTRLSKPPCRPEPGVNRYNFWIFRSSL